MDSSILKRTVCTEKIGSKKVVWRPRNQDVIPLIKLFNWKIDNITNDKIAKVRIVAKDNWMSKTVNYFSPIASKLGLRLFIFLEARFREKIKQLDVSTAFLCEELKSRIYLELPLGNVKKHGHKMEENENSFIWFT